MQSSCKFLKVFLTVSVILLNSNVIFCFAMYCFGSLSVSLREKPKDSNLKKKH